VGAVVDHVDESGGSVAVDVQMEHARVVLPWHGRISSRLITTWRTRVEETGSASTMSISRGEIDVLLLLVR